jgi:RNA polymerase sigma-70 factor (ECF subfamily)
MSLDFQAASDEELVRQSRAGSLSAFEQLVSRHEGAIYRYSLGICRNEADAREVAQDTFVRAFHALAQYQAGRSFAAWLFGIARRQCIDRLRARRRVSEELSEALVDENDPATSMMRNEEGRNVWDIARRELTEAQFEVLWLRFVEDLSVAEIAQATRRTQTHVKVLLFRARTRLSPAMEKSGERGLERSSTGGVAARLKQSSALL